MPQCASRRVVVVERASSRRAATRTPVIDDGHGVRLYFFNAFVVASRA
jgi:hypothetical protein